MSTSYLISPGHNATIFHVPHSSREIPVEQRAGMSASDQQIALELDKLTDHDTDQLARWLGQDQEQTPSYFINQLSRLVIDPERFPDESEEMLAVGMGPVYSHGWDQQVLREPDTQRDALLLEKFFHPYAAAFTELVENTLSRHDKALIVDVHSYPTRALPYELHASDDRPEICIGADDFHTPAELVATIEQQCTKHGLSSKVNQPFKGSYVPLRYWGKDKRVSSVMLEIRRDTYIPQIERLEKFLRELGGAIAE